MCNPTFSVGEAGVDELSHAFCPPPPSLRVVIRRSVCEVDTHAVWKPHTNSHTSRSHSSLVAYVVVPPHLVSWGQAASRALWSARELEAEKCASPQGRRAKTLQSWSGMHASEKRAEAGSVFLASAG